MASNPLLPPTPDIERALLIGNIEGYGLAELSEHADTPELPPLQCMVLSVEIGERAGGAPELRQVLIPIAFFPYLLRAIEHTMGDIEARKRSVN